VSALNLTYLPIALVEAELRPAGIHEILVGDGRDCGGDSSGG